MTKLSDYVPAVVVYWTETERGWGQRDNGMTIYLNEDLAKVGIAEHWAREEELNKGREGITPDYYVFPSEPKLCLVTKEFHKTLPKKGGKYTSERSPTWFNAQL